MRVLVRPKGAVRTIQASLVDSRGSPRDLRLFPIGDGTYRALCGFDTEARIEKYYLRFGFEDESGDTISVIHPFYLQKSTRETGRIILPEHTWALLSPSARKDREGEVLRAVLSTASEESLWNYTFRTPVEEPDPLSLFGKIRKYYINGAYSFTRSHRGVDLRGKRGDAVFAPNSGTVVLADVRVTTGNTIVIDHGQGVFTLLFHMDALLVETGAYVVKGQRIGEIGATGIAEGAHLHWSMCVDGTYVDPMEWVRKTF